MTAKSANSDNDLKTRKEDHGERGYLFPGLLISICLDQNTNTISQDKDIQQLTKKCACGTCTPGISVHAVPVLLA